LGTFSVNLPVAVPPHEALAYVLAILPTGGPLIGWSKVAVTWWTHKIGGLHQSDILTAAQTDELFGW
jgi:hypothetical protein